MVLFVFLGIKNLMDGMLCIFINLNFSCHKIALTSPHFKTNTRIATEMESQVLLTQYRVLLVRAVVFSGCRLSECCSLFL